MAQCPHCEGESALSEIQATLATLVERSEQVEKRIDDRFGAVGQRFEDLGVATKKSGGVSGFIAALLVAIGDRLMFGGHGS